MLTDQFGISNDVTIVADIRQLTLGRRREVMRDFDLIGPISHGKVDHGLNDKGASAWHAKAGMEGFQEFMIKPDRLDAILERLDKIQERVYK